MRIKPVYGHTHTAHAHTNSCINTLYKVTHIIYNPSYTPHTCMYACKNVYTNRTHNSTWREEEKTHLSPYSPGSNNGTTIAAPKWSNKTIVSFELLCCQIGEIMTLTLIEDHVVDIRDTECRNKWCKL